MSLLLILVCLILSGNFAFGIDKPPRDGSQDLEGNLPEKIVIEGRAKKLAIKALLLFKFLFFALLIPFSALTAKIISWNAFAVSLLAFLATKLLLLRTLLSEQTRPTGMMGMPPIVIQSLPEPFGQLKLGSKILVQSEAREDDGPIRKRWRNRQ